MSRMCVHPWDEPTDDSEGLTIQSTPRYVFDGLRAGLANQTAECSYCGTLIQSGQQLICSVYRAAETPEWLVTRCYCSDCGPAKIETPTFGTTELLVRAELGIVSVDSEQVHECCLLQVQVVADSPCT